MRAGIAGRRTGREARGIGLSDYEQADEAGISYSDIQRVMDENKEVLNTLVAPYEQVTKIMLWPNEFEKTPKKSIKRFLYNR